MSHKLISVGLFILLLVVVVYVTGIWAGIWTKSLSLDAVRLRDRVTGPRGDEDEDEDDYEDEDEDEDDDDYEDEDEDEDEDERWAYDLAEMNRERVSEDDAGNTVAVHGENAGTSVLALPVASAETSALELHHELSETSERVYLTPDQELDLIYPRHKCPWLYVNDGRWHEMEIAKQAQYRHAMRDSADYIDWTLAA